MKWDAEKYDRVNIQQFESGMELIKLADVRKSDPTLDLGCCTGKITTDLKNLTYNRIVFISRTFDEYARM